MCESYLQSLPSPVGQYKSNVFESCSSDVESFTSYSDSFAGLPGRNGQKIKLPPQLTSTCNHKRHKQSLGMGMLQKHEEFEDMSTFCKDENQSSNLSVWEEWLMTKLQIEDEKSKQKKMDDKKRKQEEIKKQQEKEEKMKIAQEKNQKWEEEKLLKIKLRKSAERREKKIKIEIEAEKKEKLKAEAEIKVNQWNEKQKVAEHQKRLEEKETKEREENLKKDRKEAAEQKYQEWLKNNRHRFAALKNISTPSPTFVNPNPWVGPNQDATRRRPSSPPPPRRCMEEQPRRFRTHSFPARRCSTPQRKARGIGTHTPMRTGSTHNRTTVGFIRTTTPLRFAGIRPKVQSRSQKRSVTYSGQDKPRKSHVGVPQPLNGMK